MIDKLRRVVTGHNAEGKSIVALDGPPGSIVGTERAGLGEIWITDRTPADNRNPADAGARPVRLEPPSTVASSSSLSWRQPTNSFRASSWKSRPPMDSEHSGASI